ncbi:hypothetical protein [Gracilibacillus alcaliphilus]|uniref:hypothetical protein n=1 Tax=Gracilibacillus alcaliphilus TaxID=1401441 RepID=UPI0019596A4D|nr:hypothetical protein [Gracilibacillus alcaliphilus]MBM7678497.1 gas vesicle protein [Gracilibacillus alcaliphilus]
MSKEKIIKGMIAGAIVGGLLTLTNRETRNYVKQGLQQCGNRVSFYMHHPTEAIHQLNVQYDYYSKQVSSSLTAVLEILNQLQDATNKLTERDQDE